MVARLRTADASFFDNTPYFSGSMKTAIGTTMAAHESNNRYADEAKPEKAVSEEPHEFPALENLVFVSQPDALGAGYLYFVTKVGGKEVVTVVNAQKTPGLYDWGVGIGYKFVETYGTYVDNVWTVEPRPVEDVVDLEPVDETDEPDAPDEPDDSDETDEPKKPDHTDGGKYKLAAKKPSLKDIKYVGSPDDFPDAIRYQIKGAAKGKYGGNVYFYASKNKYPEIYAYVKGAGEVLSWQAKAKADGFTVADADTSIPHFTEIKEGSVDQFGDGFPTLTFEMKNGDKYFVNEETSAGLYGRVKAFQRQADTVAEIDAPLLGAGAIYNEHITKVELNRDDKALPSGMLLVTLKGSPNFGDGTYVVTESGNSQAYDTALSWQQSGSKANGETLGPDDKAGGVEYGGDGREDTKDFEEEFGITRADWDVMSAETNVRSDPNDDTSRFLNVGELAMKTLREQFEEKAEQDPDGKAAKFIALLDAMAAYSSGRTIKAYTQGEAVSSISGEYLVPSEDWQGVIDYDRLMAETSAMWQDPDIQEAYTSIVSDVLGDLEGASIEERAKKLYEVVVGDPDDKEGSTLALWLGEMKTAGRGGEAELIVQNIWSSLALLDKPNENGTQKLLKDAMNEFQIQVLNVELSLEMEKGIGEDAYSETYVQDNLNHILNLIKSTPNLLRLAPRVVDFINGVLGGKYSMSTAIDVINTLNEGDRTGWLNSFDEDEFKEQFKDKIYRSPGEKSAAMGFLADLNRAGLLGSVVGSLSLGSGIYRLVKLDGGQHTAEDRLLIARDFLSALSFSEHFVKGIEWSGGKAVGGINKVFGTLISAPNIVDLMGLNSSLPEIWGKNGRWGKLVQPQTTPDLIQAIADKTKSQWGDIVDVSSKEGWLAEIDKMSPEQKALHSEMIEHLNKSGVRAGLPPKGVSSSWLAKGVGSFIKILGTGLDAVTGILDIVFNALSLAKGGNDGATTAARVFGLIGGTLNASAGIIGGVNGLLRTLSFASMSSPLFIVGTIFGVVSALIEVLSSQRKTDKMVKAQQEWLSSLADADVLKEDWGKAFEFINTWYAYAKGRNDLYDPEKAIPEGLSLFDYDRERWERFRENWEPGELPREVGNFFNEAEERSWWANEDEDLVFEWTFRDEHYDPARNISPDHPAAKEFRSVLKGLAEWYTDNIDLTQSPVRLATFGNETPKKAIEEMADFYLSYVDANADSETIAEWIKGALAEAVAGAYDNEEDGEKAAGAIGVHFDKRGGKEDMISIIDGTFTQSDGARGKFEESLNTIVSIYARTEQPGMDDDDEDKIDNDPISTKRRQLMGFGSTEIEPLFKDLIVFYLREVKSDGSAEDAAQWAIDQLKGRIGIAFRGALDSDNEGIREEAEEKIGIFMNYVNKGSRNGKEAAVSIAKEVMGED